VMGRPFGHTAWLTLPLTVCLLAGPAAAQARLQAGNVPVGTTPVTVNLARTFTSPVVVCTVRYANNSVPIVARVSNLTATSFDVRLENPSAGAVVAESVSYVVVEEGVWTIDDLVIEAQTYLSTHTDHDGGWSGEVQGYGQAYADPVVLGQVMTENDSDWSVFWCHGSGSQSPPSAGALWTGKTVCEDPDLTRLNETVGFLVVETDHGLVNGVAFEAALGADSVQGIDNSPPYTYNFDTAFATVPEVGLLSMAGMDGNNGGWALLWGSTPTTTTSMRLVIDEDQLGDSERNHTTEQVGYLVFETPVLYPNATPDDPAGLARTECPQGGGTDKTPTLGFTLADADGDDLTFRLQVDDTDNTFGSLVVDYTSAAQAGGAAAFTVGQAAGGGSYAVGSAGQELGPDTYFWRVQSTDGFATSAWVQGASFTVVEPTVDFSAGTYSGGEAAGPITLTVDLSDDSCQTITVNYASSDGTAAAPGDYGAVSGTFTFNPGDTTRTFTVTPVSDSVDEADETVTLTLSGPQDATLAGVNNPATLTITDDDTAGVTITESAGSTGTVEGGATDSYTVVLDSQPTGNVTVTATPDTDGDLGSGAATAVTRTFTPGDWSVPQVITVTAVNDDIAEGAHTATITHTAASTDGNYDGIAIAGVTANITDNDTAGVTVTHTAGGTAVTEGGSTDTYSLVLTSRPTADVVITVDPDAQADLGAGPGGAVALTFTNADWDTPQSVTVTAVDDDVDEGAHTATITHTAASPDGFYDAIAIANATADITDNDTAGVTVAQSGGTTDVTEGGATDSYTVVLESEPTADVTVTVTPDAELDVGGGAGVAVTLTFTNADWDTPQTVTVTAVDDDLDEDAEAVTITHSVASTDGKYGGIGAGGVTVNITDDDTAGVTLTESGGTTAATEGGATDTYTVVLDSRPAATVTVTVDPDAQTDLGGGPGAAIQLIFAPGAWSAGQAVTVTAVDDSVAEGVHASTITHSVASVDPKYNGLDLSGDDLTVSITDNDAAGVTLAESGAGTSVIETGATDTYSLVLDSKPTADVTVTVDPDDQTGVGAGTDVAIQLTFTTANWFTPQVLTVIPFDDAIFEGGHTSTITHTAASTDPTYDGMAIPNLVVNVADDDVAGVTLTETGGTTAATEGGAADTYTIVLDSEPTGPVTVTVTPDGQTDLGSGAGVAVNLVFTAGDWASARTVTVTAFDDAVDEDAHSSTISHSVVSGDGDYNGMAVSDVIATITDNDTAGVTITESGGTTAATEGGAADTYEVVLDTRPTAAVIITLDPDAQSHLGAAAGAPIQFTFTTGNWSVPQTATVTAVNDDVAEGAHTSTIVHSTSSTDARYDGLDLSGANVVAALTDNDTAGVTILETAGATNVSEAGVADTYTLVLDSEPTGNVTVTLTPDDDGNLGVGAATAVTRTFTPGDWSVPQVITVTAVNDDIAEGAHTATVTHTAASTDGCYDGIAIADVSANVTDNDTAGVIVTPTGGTTAVTEGGATDTYALVLASEPTADVAVTVDPDAQSDVGAGSGTASTLTFTAANWDTPQDVTVTAVDDDVDEGAHTSAITHTSASTDGFYDGIAIANTTADVADNDTAGVTVTESSGSTEVTEGGSSDTYTVVLDSEPAADVTVTGTPNAELDLGGGAGVAISLTFTAADWDTPQTVTVTAVDDDVEVGDRVGTITHVAASADGNYNGPVLPDIVPAIMEDDVAGVSIAETGGHTAVTEGAATDSYQVVLNSQPETDVLITADPGGQVDLGAGPGTPVQLTFTPVNWSTPQTVTVTAVDDTDDEGPHSATVVHTTVSGDGKYSGITVTTVAVSITDNDGVDPGGGGPAGDPGADTDPDPDQDGDDSDGVAEEGEPPQDEDPEPWPDDEDDGEGEPPEWDGEPDPPAEEEPPAPEQDHPPADDPELPPQPEVRVRIEMASTTLRVGDELGLTVVVTNVGTADACDLDITLRLSDNGEWLAAETIGKEDAWEIDVAALAGTGEARVFLGDLAAGESIEVELWVRAVAGGTLTLAAEIGSEQTVLTEESAELEVEHVFTERVTIRRPAGYCGAAALPAAIGLGLLMTLRMATGRRINTRRAWRCRR